MAKIVGAGPRACQRATTGGRPYIVDEIISRGIRMTDELKPSPKLRSEDRSHDVLRAQPRPRSLDSLLRPNSVAVIGATEREGSVGRAVLANLLKPTYKGIVYPVNPNHKILMGEKAYANLTDLPESPDLAVIATPAESVPGLIDECLAAGVKSAIILSAGFKEMGAQGAELEKRIAEKIKGKRFRVLGPNCLGVINPHWGLNATFAAQSVTPGSVAFLSQSGAMVTAILDWTAEAGIGFSTFVSTGSMMDVGWGDLIDSLWEDPHTQSILLYMESVGDAAAFLSAAREVAFTKPILVLKAGRTEAASKAAVSHTGALAGSYSVLQAALARVGALSVEKISDLFHMAQVLANQPRPKGRRLLILTNAGGPGVLATDALIEGGGEMAHPSPETLAALNQTLPAHWSHANPVDVLGDADPERYAKAVAIALKDENSDGLLAILTPQEMTDPPKTVELFQALPPMKGKPFLTSLMGGKSMEALQYKLRQSGIPSFPYPDTAVRIFNYMWRYNSNLNGLYETAMPSGEDSPDSNRLEAEKLLLAVQASGRTLLSEFESKQVMAHYGIPVVPTRLANSEEDAVKVAQETGFPVVLKLNSLTLTHKSDVGGVRLDLKRTEDVREAYKGIQTSVEAKAGAGHFQGVTVQPMVQAEGIELILGSSPDPQFGPVLLFGAGGKLVEVMKDSALGLPPLTTTLARRLMEQTRIYAALKGVRGMPPADMPALEKLLARFSSLVMEQPLIREIDINPLCVYGSKILALDARIVLNDPKVDRALWPKPVIRPYPQQYVSTFKLKDGTPAVIRPIRAEDESLLMEFNEGLSGQTVYMRYFEPKELSLRVAHQRLVRLCFLDYSREIAIVAEQKDPSTGKPRLLGVGRLSRSFGDGEMEFSLVVGDSYQHLGLGTELLRKLVEIGKAEGLKRISGYILPENSPMQNTARKLGFTVQYSNEEKVLKAELGL